MPTSPTLDADAWQTGFMLGDWHVDVNGNRLMRGAEVRPLRHKAMELLLLLARNAGSTVTRDEIVDAVWAGNRFVAPKAINTAVWTIRQTLEDDPDSPRYLETIAKKGYRLIAPVRPLPGAPAPPPAIAPPAQQRPVPVAWLAAVASVALVVAFGLWRGMSGTDPAVAVAPTTTAAPVPLTQEPGVEYIGALSPDGTRLAFAWWRGSKGGELHLRTVDAAIGPSPSAPQPLATGQGDVMGLSWAPDGSAIGFAALADDGRCRVWLQALPPGDAQPPPPRPLASCAPLNTPLMAWSPDGRQIVFSAEHEGAGGLFSIAPDGSDLRRITTAPPAAMADHQPSWAPDGTHLAFVRQDPADGTRDLYEWRPNGDVRRLTTLKLHFLHGLAHAADGVDLVFSTTVQDARVLQRWQRADGRVTPLGLEGSAPTRATDGSLVYSLMRTHVSLARLAFRGATVRTLQGVSSDRAPRPDPSGGRLAFISRRGGGPELWLAASDGSGARALTSLGGIVEEPAWSPGADRLAFIGSCGPGGRIGLCTVAAAGGAPQPLSTDAASYGAPAWHPQHDEIWVASDRGGSWQLWRFPAGSGAGSVEPTVSPPGMTLQWLTDGSGFVYQPRGESHLRWRTMVGPQAGREQRIDVTVTGEDLIDWQLADGKVTTLTRSDRDRWRRVDLASGSRQSLADQPLGTLPERARFALAGPDAVWVEVANTQVADLMRLR